MINIDGIFTYPVKSCRGIEHSTALLTDAGLEHDREWMFASPEGQFLTQRDAPRLALVRMALDDRE